MHDDLRFFDAGPDQFQIIAKDAAGGALLVIFALLLLFWPYV